METLTAKANNILATALSTAAAGGSLKIYDGATMRCEIPLETVPFDAVDNVMTARGQDGATAISEANYLAGTSVQSGDWTTYEVCDDEDDALWTGGPSDMTLTIVGDEVRVIAWATTINAE